MTRLESMQGIFEQWFWPHPHISLNITELKERYDDLEGKPGASIVDLLKWALEEEE